MDNKNVRSHHLQYIYQLHDFHTRRKIFQMGHWGILLGNAHGEIIIYKTPQTLIPPDTIAHYKVNDLFNLDGWIYM